MYANRIFASAMTPFLKDYATERLITNLQSELQKDDETDWQAEIEKMMIAKEQKGC